MGFLTNHIRHIYLILYRNDLQYKLNTIAQTKLQIASSVNELVNVGSDLDPNSPEVKLLEERRKNLQLAENKLDAAIERYKMLLQAAQTEIESVSKHAQEGIKSSFSY